MMLVSLICGKILASGDVMALMQRQDSFDITNRM